MNDEQKADARHSLRKLAREAVVFALLGFVFVLAADFVLDSRHANPAFQVQEDATGNRKSPDPFATFGGHRYAPLDFFPLTKPNASIDYALLVDPRFQRLPPAGKRAALESATGDKDFASLSDAETMEFVSRMQAKGVLVVAPGGEVGSILAERLSDALAAGYRRADIFDEAALPVADKWDKYAVPEKWDKYAVPSQHLPQKTWRENTLAWIHAFVFHFLVGTIVGLPSGLVVWGFYRLIRFAVLG